MRTLIASSALAAVAALSLPQLASAQVGNPVNEAPYCLMNPDGQANCSFQSMNSCEQNSARFGADFRCVENPHSGADRVFREVEPGATIGEGEPRLRERR
jgi:hypothetical protein